MSYRRANWTGTVSASETPPQVIGDRRERPGALDHVDDGAVQKLVAAALLDAVIAQAPVPVDHEMEDGGALLTTNARAPGILLVLPQPRLKPTQVFGPSVG